MSPSFNFRDRSRAAGLHFLISLVLAALTAALVFGVWYPGPYKQLSGGQGLFYLVMTVDVVLGPLLTFAIFDRNKGWPHLRRDLTIIGLIQVSALVYGLHVVYVARPVALVFEVDRFKVLSADQIKVDELPNAPSAYRRLPLTGPWELGTRNPQPGKEKNDVLFLALAGIDIGQRPSFWQPYAESKSAALAKSRPWAVLLKQYPTRSAEFQERLREFGLNDDTARFLPTLARGDWVAILDATGGVAGFLPADGFF